MTAVDPWDKPAERASWVVVASHRLDNGDLEVTYSLAPSYHYVAQVRPGVDAAASIQRMGDFLFAQYSKRGYV